VKPDVSCSGLCRRPFLECGRTCARSSGLGSAREPRQGFSRWTTSGRSSAPAPASPTPPRHLHEGNG